MSVYLHDIPLKEAWTIFLKALESANLWRVLGSEDQPLDENVLGRVLAEPIWAKVSSPNYHASAMDGFAVRSAETTKASPSHPVSLEVGSDCCYLDTGDAMPEGYDAVIPIEGVESLDDKGNITLAIRRPSFIRIRATVTPWSHVRPMGEDIVQSQLVLATGQVLRPVDLGMIAAAGYQEVRTARPPKVAILPTGTELVPLGSSLKAGDILETNSLLLAAQVKSWGGSPSRFPILPDDLASICGAVEKAARTHDLILINAGSSAGAEDFSARVVEQLGTLLVHGVAVRPGHPVILGMIHGYPSATGDKAGLPGPVSVPIIGVPGYPVSAALTGEIFVEPLLAKWLGRDPLTLPVEQAVLTRKITSPGGDDDYVRVVVGNVRGKRLASPLSRGAGILTSLARADGLLILPQGVQGAEAGTVVDVHLYRSRAELERTIFCVGSHDMTIDLLAQSLSEHDRRLVSANVGSLGGLIALKRGEAHLAGSHLLDPVSGEYNLTYIRQYLSGVPVKVFGFVGRKQGLMVRKGNPKGLHGLEDLTLPTVRFINRQRGAGTRVLLEHQLTRRGIEFRSIQGFDQEEYTHLGVAAAVASGRADCGLGIPAAAQSLDLDFIPLFDEEYQLIVPVDFAESALLAPLFEIIRSTQFQHSVNQLPGYDTRSMGRLLTEI